MDSLTPKLLSQNIGEVEIQYLYYEGEGPAIIMMHATGFLPWLWHPIARELAGEYKVIAPYFCDYRSAAPEEGGLKWAQLADDLCEFCKRLHVNKPLLVGHSMGGAVMTLAESAHGPYAEKMILIEPIFLPQPLYSFKMRVQDHPLARKSIKRLNHWDNPAEARRYLRSRPLFQKWDAEMLELYLKYGMIAKETGGLELACHPRKEASLFMGSAQTDPWPLMPKVQCPALIIEGSESENRGFIDFKKAASLFPKGHYRLVEGAGHLIPMEMPRETTEIIREFFLITQ